MRILKRLCLVYLLTGASVAPAHAHPTVIVDVRGYTLVHDQLERFSALAFENGRVIATGPSADLRKRFPDANLVEGHRSTLLPGLIDAHGHVLDLGFEATQLVLTDTVSLEDAKRRIGAYAKANPDRHWVLGSGWNQVKWKLGRFPVAAELDAAVADRPALLARVDGHAEWLNSAALYAAGITRSTPDPDGGRIERDAHGNPTGVLVDKAMDLADKVIPPFTLEERRDALREALVRMNEVGLTSVGDAGDTASDIELFRTFADEHRLTVRIYAMIRDTRDDFRTLSKAGPLLGYAEDRLTVRAVKLFADGALGSRGAALLAPYSDQHAQHGLLFMSNDEMEADIETALRAGYQVNVHAIGDAANRQVLNGFEAAYRKVGGRALRNRIEHAQVVALPDIPRFKELDLIASMQPTHATSDMNMAKARIGAARLEGAYAWRLFLNQGTRIAAGSDFPVESPNPFFGLHAAITRQDHANEPRGGWHSEQAMTRLEAFRAFTTDAAFAQHQEGSIGSLEPGKWADFVVIDKDIFRMSAQQIWRVKVQQTWVAGERVF